MPFCTVLEWDEFDMALFDELRERTGGDDKLPDGCVARIAGTVGTGARVIEVWKSPDDARRFADQNTELIRELNIPTPTGVVAFETTLFVTRG